MKPYFVDDIPKDPLIGGDGSLDRTKVHAHENSISIELESSFSICSSLQSSGMQQFIKNLWIYLMNLRVQTIRLHTTGYKTAINSKTGL